VHIQAIWLWVAVVVVVAFLIGQFFRKPGQVAWLILRSIVIGCLFVFAVNWIGSYIHFHLPFNPLTALTAGFLGIPGIVALIAMQLWVFT
jgi:inhibitor of the pro-sigma K processing machinery